MDVLLNNDVETVDFGESAMRVKLTREVIEVKEINDIGSVRILMLKGEKGDVGYPTDEQVSEAVDEWLTAHPEATTTVQDNSLTWVKFNDVLKNMMFKLGITDSKSGEVVSTSDAAEFPLKDLQSEITATQNLNGYEYPWVGGAGENLLDPNIKFPNESQFGLTITSDGYNFSYTGTATSSGNIYSTNVSSANAVILPAGTYISKNGTLSLYKANGGWLRNQYSGVAFTIDEPFYVRNIYWEIVEGRTYNANNFIALAKGSTAPSAWTPYENICPISGRTEVNVTRTGANLISHAPIDVTPNTIVTTELATLFLKKGTYTLSYTLDTTVTATRNGPTCIIGSETIYGNDIKTAGRGSWTFTIEEDTTARINWWYHTVSTACTISDFLLELGSTATAYEPYEGDTFNTELGRTVYGGSLDLTTGVLTVNTGLIASYNGETIGEPWISDRDRYVAGTTPTIGAQVVYTKDSETYQVDRTEVDAYFKNNTIWSDSGDVAVSYLVDAKTYIDNQ